MQYEAAKSFILGKLSTELPAHLSYHSEGHVRDVCDATQQIATSEGITGEDLTLLLTAALFHDSGFLHGAAEHEKKSCEIASRHLPDFGYTSGQIDKICGMIMATRIPQNPQTHLEQILADADLDYLGRDDFFTIGERLYEEFAMYGIVSSRQDWNRLQVKFLENHHYFTQTSIKMRKPKKDEHLRLLKSEVAKNEPT
jgi:uncharacterized protein